MRIVGFNRVGASHPEAERVWRLDDLPLGLPLADVVVVTLALTARTRGLLGEAAFDSIKPGALFVNVARGEIVDQPALAAALSAGHLSGAAIDVTNPEPLKPDDPLWMAPNLLVSPHVGAAGGPALHQRLAEIVISNIRGLRNGGELLHLVRET